MSCLYLNTVCERKKLKQNVKNNKEKCSFCLIWQDWQSAPDSIVFYVFINIFYFLLGSMLFTTLGGLSALIMRPNIFKVEKALFKKWRRSNGRTTTTPQQKRPVEKKVCYLLAPSRRNRHQKKKKYKQLENFEGKLSLQLSKLSIIFTCASFETREFSFHPL